MDLGSLELQIFVSLTVVLGGAFVALVCDYLKGNNEQLREHNIELRVRKEEQERRLLLDPAGFLGQWMPGQRQAIARTATAADTSAATRPVAPHEVMHSFADPEALAEAEERAAKLHARAGDEAFESADVPPLTQRRSGRNRVNRKSSRQVRKEPENYADWVRPEVIAKVARRAQATVAYSSDIREELDSLAADALPEPLNPPENWDIRQQLPGNERGKREQPKRSTAQTAEAPATAAVTAAPVAVMAEPVVQHEPAAAAAQIPAEAPLPEQLAPEQAAVLQKEIERVAQLERRPVVAAPGTILRPLTVPSLKLEEELQRVAEIAPVAAPAPSSWNSALLDEVIAASGSREAVTQTAVPEQAVEHLVSLPNPTVAVNTVAVPAVLDEELVAPQVEKEVQAAVELIEELPVVAALEPEPIATNPMAGEAAAAELVSVEIALDHNGYWDHTPGSDVGESLNDNAPPVAILPEAALGEVFQAHVLPLDLPAELEVLSEGNFAFASLPQQGDGVVERRDLCEPFALLAEPAANVAEAYDVLVSEPESPAAEPDLAPLAIAELAESVAVVNLQELTIELPFPAVESAPSVVESESFVFGEVSLSPDMTRPDQSEQTEFGIPQEAPLYDAEPELSPVTVDAASVDTDIAPPSFLYLIEPIGPVELHEVEPQLPVVLEEAYDSSADVVADAVSAEEEMFVEPPPFIFDLDAQAASEPSARVKAVEEEMSPMSSADIIDCYSFWPHPSRLAGMGISPAVDYLQSIPGVETPLVQLPLVAEPVLALQNAASDLESSVEDTSELPELLPAYADLSWDEPAEGLAAEPEVAAVVSEPPPLWVPEPVAQQERDQSLPVAAPIDISVLRQPEPESIVPAPAAVPDLLLPTGMHDISTWIRLMSLPNPMTGILIVISLQPSENLSALSQSKGAPVPDNNAAAIEKFMASFVREGDFGSHISDNQWVFIYSNDVAGFNQRRVGMISEKLWDFQLRHLGLANVNFKWGAIDVQSEPLPAALEAARDRMNQTNRTRKLPGADRAAPRRVVNG